MALRRVADYSLPHETPLYGVIAAFAALAAISIWRDRARIWPTHTSTDRSTPS